jgi:hypothetical protein
MEFTNLGIFDGALNTYQAKNVINGAPLPKVRPNTLLVNVLGVTLFGYSETGAKIIQMVMQLAAMGLLFYMLSRLYGIIPAGIGILIASFYLSYPFFAKHGNVKEQFMIACMMITISSWSLHFISRQWFWMVISGMFAINIYFFKETGVSAILSILVVMFLLPLFKVITWKLWCQNMGLLVIGGMIGVLPSFILFASHGEGRTLIRKVPFMALIVKKGVPKHNGLHSSVVVQKRFPVTEKNKEIAQKKGKLDKGYLGGSRSVSSFKTQAITTIKYYRFLSLPIGMGVCGIFICFIRIIMLRIRRKQPDDQEAPLEIARCREYIIWVFLICWILDMAFVWISPRSYVEYYLPLIGSGAMVSAYVVYHCLKLKKLLIGVVAMIALVQVAVPLSAGHKVVKPFEVASDFISRIQTRVKSRETKGIALWEQIANIVKEKSKLGDGLYVWGWYPGIYVSAQRFAPVTRVSEANMHTDRPGDIRLSISTLVSELKENPPKFIVDSQKMHYPYWDHPVFDLWPRWQSKNKRYLYFHFRPIIKGQQYMGLHQYVKVKESYFDAVQTVSLRKLSSPKRLGGALPEDRVEWMAYVERRRHEAMDLLRMFVMENYHPLLGADTGMLLYELNTTKNNSK